MRLSLKTTSCHALLGAVLLSFVAAGATRGESVMLKARFPDGVTNYLSISEVTSQTIEAEGMPGGKMQMTNKRHMGVMQSSSAEKDGSAKVVMTFDRVSMQGDNPMVGRLVYDSDMPSPDDAPYIRQILEPMLGMSMTMVVDADANITAFTGMADIVRKIEDSASANPLLMMIKPSLTDDVAKSEWGRSRLAFLPNREVKVGESWDVSYTEELPQLGKFEFKWNCKLNGVEKEDGRRIADISYTGEMRQIEKSDATNAPDTERATFSGEADFDVDRGQLVERENKLDMVLKVPSMGGGTAKVTIDQTETMEIISKAERKKQKEANRAKAEKMKAAAKADDKDIDEEDDDNESDY